jgi:hypothetical protein
MIKYKEPNLSYSYLSKDGRDLLKKLLIKDPKKRIGCGEHGY